MNGPDRERANRHPPSQPILRRLLQAANKRGERDHRRRTLAGLHGRMVEIGAGDGANFDLYPAEVTDVTAIEPEQPRDRA